MIEYSGPKKIKTAVFISGTGSNLKNLIKFSKQRNFPISVDLIISNNAKAKGLIYANNFKIKKKVFNFSNKIIAEKKILSLLFKSKIELICLAESIETQRGGELGFAPLNSSCQDAEVA